MALSLDQKYIKGCRGRQTRDAIFSNMKEAVSAGALLNSISHHPPTSHAPSGEDLDRIPVAKQTTMFDQCLHDGEQVRPTCT